MIHAGYSQGIATLQVCVLYCQWVHWILETSQLFISINLVENDPVKHELLKSHCQTVTSFSQSLHREHYIHVGYIELSKKPKPLLICFIYKTQEISLSSRAALYFTMFRFFGLASLKMMRCIYPSIICLIFKYVVQGVRLYTHHKNPACVKWTCKALCMATYIHTQLIVA